MKIFSVLKAFFILLVFSLLSLVISCESRADTVSCFPSQIINVQLNLNLPAYAIDLNTKGWIYINEQQSGTRGLILVKTGTGFKVYDRNAPHLCPDTNNYADSSRQNQNRLPKRRRRMDFTRWNTYKRNWTSS